MFLKLFAKLFNWEIVALYDFDGDVNFRRVIEFGGKRFAWRYGAVRKVELLPDGEVGHGLYVKRWETVIPKRIKKTTEAFDKAFKPDTEGTNNVDNL